VKERTDQLQHQALHDSLTGLPNRALILDRIDQMLALQTRTLEVAALFLDIDNFKDINDTLGHRAGTSCSSASRPIEERRARERHGRTTRGDEFVVWPTCLLGGWRDVVLPPARRHATPFIISASKLPLNVSASIGIAEVIERRPRHCSRRRYRATKRSGGKQGRDVHSVNAGFVDHHRRLKSTSTALFRAINSS